MELDESTGHEPDTYFAPAARADAAALHAAIDAACTNELLSTVLRCFAGAIAVLNLQRQVVAVNHAYLRLLGITDPETALGLRPGEAIRCVHADDHVSGCGTSLACTSCGAAIAIVTAQRQGVSVERECVLTARTTAGQLDLDLLVRATPLQLDGQSFTLLFLIDLTTEKRRAALERAFFHDVNNLVAGLAGAAEFFEIEDASERPALCEEIRSLAARLAKEVELQRLLAQREPASFKRSCLLVSTREALRALGQLVAHHPATAGKILDVAPEPDVAITTDPWLLQRVLLNMVVNALEASEEGQTVRVWAEASTRSSQITFCVHNRRPIPAALAPRIFQRYFTTKPGIGRGQGTYIIKLLGERYLDGEVSFTTSESDGTTFRLKLPLGR